jgi:hypothetical protein
MASVPAVLIDNLPAHPGVSAKTLEEVLLRGDLSPLSPDQRNSYYRAVCTSLGLNPLTKPFEYLSLDGRLVLYARKDCAEQLRKIHKISVEIVHREKWNECYVVTARATLPNGRYDQSTGVVPIVREGGKWEAGANGKRFFKGDGSYTPLRPDELANALMKAETKAKRRVTLSICGLAVLDESELDTIPPERLDTVETTAVDNHTGHGVGKYAAPEQVEAYESWAFDYCERLENAWGDRWQQATGDLPGQAAEFRPALLSLHLIRWGVTTGRIVVDTDPASVKPAQAPKYAAILFARDEQATKDEAKVWAATAAHAANERLKAALPAPEREPGED